MSEDVSLIEEHVLMSSFQFIGFKVVIANFTVDGKIIPFTTEPSYSVVNESNVVTKHSACILRGMSSSRDTKVNICV